MAQNASELIAELRTMLARRQGEDDHAVTALISRMAALAELVEKQDEKIKELEHRLDLRSR